MPKRRDPPTDPDDGSPLWAKQSNCPKYVWAIRFADGTYDDKGGAGGIYSLKRDVQEATENK